MQLPSFYFLQCIIFFLRTCCIKGQHVDRRAVSLLPCPHCRLASHNLYSFCLLMTHWYKYIMDVACVRLVPCLFSMSLWSGGTCVHSCRDICVIFNRGNVCWRRGRQRGTAAWTVHCMVSRARGDIEIYWSCETLRSRTNSLTSASLPEPILNSLTLYV